MHENYVDRNHICKYTIVLLFWSLQILNGSDNEIAFNNSSTRIKILKNDIAPFPVSLGRRNSCHTILKSPENCNIENKSLNPLLKNYKMMQKAYFYFLKGQHSKITFLDIKCQSENLKP